MADQLTILLRDEGFTALAIHGDKKQNERDWVMAEFKSNRAPILIAVCLFCVLFKVALSDSEAYFRFWSSDRRCRSWIR